jgi:hypothetical protein
MIAAWNKMKQCDEERDEKYEYDQSIYAESKGQCMIEPHSMLIYHILKLSHYTPKNFSQTDTLWIK